MGNLKEPKGNLLDINKTEQADLLQESISTRRFGTSTSGRHSSNRMNDFGYMLEHPFPRHKECRDHMVLDNILPNLLKKT